jgi:hypothetical protein
MTMLCSSKFLFLLQVRALARNKYEDWPAGVGPDFVGSDPIVEDDDF